MAALCISETLANITSSVPFLCQELKFLKNAFLLSGTVFFKERIIQITIHSSNPLGQPEEKYIKQVITFTVGEGSYSLVPSTMIKSKMAKCIFQFTRCRTTELKN